MCARPTLSNYNVYSMSRRARIHVTRITHTRDARLKDAERKKKHDIARTIIPKRYDRTVVRDDSYYIVSFLYCIRARRTAVSDWGIFIRKLLGNIEIFDALKKQNIIIPIFTAVWRRTGIRRISWNKRTGKYLYSFSGLKTIFSKIGFINYARRRRRFKCSLIETNHIYSIVLGLCCHLRNLRTHEIIIIIIIIHTWSVTILFNTKIYYSW